MEKCRARLHTNADTGAVLRELGTHLHGENVAKVEVAEALTAIKRRAEETIEGTAQVVNESVQNLSQGCTHCTAFITPT